MKMEQPQFTVTLFGQEPFKVTVSNGDLVRWDMERSKRGWPEMGQAANLWGSYVCFLAARRTGQYNQMWDSWIDEVEEVAFEDNSEADPTIPAPEAG